MSEQLTLPAETRDRAGKGASRALRRDGRVPAVVYGDKKEPLTVHVEEKLLTKVSVRHTLGREGLEWYLHAFAYRLPTLYGLTTVAIAVGALVLDETITAATLVGFVLVLAGCWLATRVSAAAATSPRVVEPVGGPPPVVTDGC